MGIAGNDGQLVWPCTACMADRCRTRAAGDDVTADAFDEPDGTASIGGAGLICDLR